MEKVKTPVTTAKAVNIIAVASDAAISKLAIATDKASDRLLKVAEYVALNLKTVAASANEAAIKLLATQAEAALKVTNVASGGDHDSIIRIITLLEVAQADITEIKAGTTTKILDHETRLQNLENSRGIQRFTLTAGMVILGIIVTMLVYHLFGIKI